MKKALLAAALLIGILLALHIRSFRKVEAIIQRSQPVTLMAELRAFQIANETLRASIQEREKELSEKQTKLASVTVEEEINRLRLMSGEDPVFGKGIEITIDKPVEAFWISDLIAELVAASGEAIAINDVRLTMRTAGFREVAEGLLMRSDFLTPPLRITVIGPPEKLVEKINAQKGIIERMKAGHPSLTVLISKRDNTLIPALRELPE